MDTEGLATSGGGCGGGVNDVNGAATCGTTDGATAGWAAGTGGAATGTTGRLAG